MWVLVERIWYPHFNFVVSHTNSKSNLNAQSHQERNHKQTKPTYQFPLTFKYIILKAIVIQFYREKYKRVPTWEPYKNQSLKFHFKIKFHIPPRREERKNDYEEIEIGIYNWACQDKLIKPKVDESPMVIIIIIFYFIKNSFFFFLNNPKIHFKTYEASRKEHATKKKKKKNHENEQLTITCYNLTWTRSVL